MIRKAIVPVAGRGTRLMPVTSVVPKAMFPIVCRNQTIKCLIHLILEQIIAAEIEHIGVIVSEWQIDMVKQYFKSFFGENIGKLPVHIEYIIQPSPKGFGDAVLESAVFVGDEPFLVLLGDHIYIEKNGEPPCTKQVVRAFNSSDAVAMIGVQQVSAGELSKVGVVGGTRIEENIYLCRNFVEKPSLKMARQKLVTDGLQEGNFLAHCGIYAFKSEIFNCLRQVEKETKRSGREVELAQAQALLLNKYPRKYLLCEIAGKAYDIGTPQGYADAQYAFWVPILQKNCKMRALQGKEVPKHRISRLEVSSRPRMATSVTEDRTVPGLIL
jgi:UTP--glucose-1-phosphate uridylyltransferase